MAILPYDTTVAVKVFMGRTYAGAREDMSDVVGTSSSSAAFEGRGGAVYEGDGYHHRGGLPPPPPPPGEGGNAGGDDGNPAKAEASGGSGYGSVSVLGPRRRTGESPVQRLVRLREETAMLAEDLEEMSKV